jgi:hypothetical protein
MNAVRIDHDHVNFGIMTRRPVQVFLEEEELEQLERWARGRGWTKFDALRAAIRAMTRPREEDSLLAASGMIEGLPPDLSEQVDRYLEESFVAEKKPPGYPRRRRR